LGNKEWQNHLILGRCLATGTQNGKPWPGGTTTGDYRAKKNPSLPLLEIRKKLQQMENLEHCHSKDKRLDHNNNKIGGGGIGEPKNSSHGWQ
jgi:hypothetical protein